MASRAEPTAVVGWGSLNPLGADADSTWTSVIAGHSGIQTLQAAWTEDLPVRLAGCVPTRALDSLPPLLRRRSDRCAQLALVAARQAWAMAGSITQGLDPSRIAVVIGTGIGGLATMHEQHTQLSAGGPSRVNPLTVPMLIPDAAAGQVAIEFGLLGGAHTPVSACASGAEALMLGQMLLNDDRADLVLAGGSEAPVNRLGLVGFAAMRALSGRNDAPDQASRPYGLNRDGFVLSEGAGVLALMRQRDTPAGADLGWLLASGSSSDAHHIVSPEPQGLQASRAIDDALRRADVSASDLCGVQAHATGTSLGDLAEARALRRSLGSAADHLPVCAPKGQLGHLLGGAGAVETILALQALRHGVLPGSLNADPLDPEVELAVANQGPVELSSDQGQRLLLKNAFGFGGHNISLVLAGSTPAQPG
ncbi:beta-ketoacyl-[acyl-carrier-protein] synthase family protein [Synechococcus sp. A15-24]|uniref:beta-ketoacyl-[acyl-carrier-protein] synthase family protein n=1 Tax=Synechococcus sp. A15-24 TaxID=1050635 RepID=UPI0016454497|nr:beta-ketoacyl-[acyl-carrier-protein] synthase family protein [Synechococcus sp. A15-24]QNJ28202.1 putative beta-ketoacyl-(acyl-carrier-protein) synthase II (KASII) [Synechococcus sp. A15-24]